MEQMIQALLGPQWVQWKATLSAQLNVSDDQAGQLLGAAAQQVMGLFTQGKLDVAALQAPQGVARLLEQLDLQALAQNVGIDAARLEGGLGRVLPELVQSARALLGGAGGIGDLFNNLNKNS